MDIREHSITLVSVIVGLGLTELLGNLNRLVRSRRDVRWHALPLIWATGSPRRSCSASSRCAC